MFSTLASVHIQSARTSEWVALRYCCYINVVHSVW